MHTRRFRHCPKCGHSWPSREDFISDPEISLVEYAANFEDLTAGVFAFNHTCGTCIEVKAELFLDLYNGPIFKGKKVGTHECPGFCLYAKALLPCPEFCECACIRELIPLLSSHGVSRREIAFG
jgi:hypothetical protein